MRSDHLRVFCWSLSGCTWYGACVARARAWILQLTPRRPSLQPLADAYTLLYPLLIENHFERALVLSTPSYVVSEDKGAFKWRALVGVASLISADAVKEMIAIGEATASVPSVLKWTVFRVPMLTNGKEAPVKATYTGSGDDYLMLTRAGMAEWVLKEMVENKWVGKAPMLCNA